MARTVKQTDKPRAPVGKSAVPKTEPGKRIDWGNWSRIMQREVDIIRGLFGGNARMQVAKKRRRKGGGAKPMWAPEQIAHYRAVYQHELETDPELLVAKQLAKAAHLREVLKVSASDSHLKRHIIRPVDSQQASRKAAQKSQ